MNETLEINFKGREEYLAWRREWKARYREVTQSIRNLKEAHKIHMAAYNKAALNGRYAYQVKMEEEVPHLLEHQQEKLIRYRATAEKFKGKHGFYPLGQREVLSVKANCMMGLLEQAKEEAQAQWEAEHPDLVEASRAKREADKIAKEKRIAAKIAANKAEREGRRSKFRQEAQTSTA